ncbi:DUF4476 domain-containing protein [Cytophagaceae bacterium AH-315-L13]|nr:DUF4476 domain-containing protein [Cytophagaceae bacterium AH-315-L13]
MKRLITLLSFAALLSIEVMAGHNNSNLSIRMTDNSQITIVFDGIEYDQVSTKFKIKDVHPGMHRLKVVRHSRYWKYSHHHRDEIVYDGYVDVDPNCDLSLSVNPWHGLRIKKRRKHYDYNNNHHYNEGYDHHDQNHHSYGCGFHHMTTDEFHELKHLVDEQWFDSSKKRVAMHAIEHNHLSAHQIKCLVDMMDFESSKLDLAKYAYNKTCDISNFHVVFDAFDFHSSVDELSLYMVMR